MRSLIGKSKLVVHSYDSTGILETLALNIPTICFWQNGLAHLNDEEKPYYQLLVEAGIIALSPDLAAKHVASIWTNIPDWWFSERVQEARLKFCSRYARTESNPVISLRNLLIKHSEECQRHAGRRGVGEIS